MCVCLLSHISPLERLFVLKILSRTQQAMEVKNMWGFSCSVAEIQHSSLKAIRTVGHFPAESVHAYLPRIADRYHELSFVCCHWSCLQARSVHNSMNSWRGVFCTLVHSLLLQLCPCVGLLEGLPHRYI